jgi:hypothetical protein
MISSIRPTRAGLVAITLALGAIAPAAHAADVMTRQKVIEYETRFSAQDPRFAEIYAPDVSFPHITGGELRGPKQIADFYQKMWATGVHEVREPTAIIIDNKGGMMAVEESVSFTPKPGFASVTLPTGEVMKAGEKWKGAAVMIFTLRDGKVTSVRGSIVGAGKITRAE